MSEEGKLWESLPFKFGEQPGRELDAPIIMADPTGKYEKAPPEGTMLSGDGWTGHFGGNIPVQGEGTVDGRPFYFRARHEHWSLSVSAVDGSPVAVRNGMQDGFLMIEDWPHGAEQAGWMELSDVQQCMEKAVAAFRAEKAKS